MENFSLGIGEMSVIPENLVLIVGIFNDLWPSRSLEAPYFFKPIDSEVQ